MKKVLLSMFLVLILSGCSIDWNWEKDQKIIKLEKEIEDYKKEKENDLFKKNIECINQTTNLIKKTKEIWEKYISQWNFSFEQVFYSPKYNNCLWVRIIEQELNNWWYITHKSLYELWNDSWSSKPISWCSDLFIIWDKLEDIKKENDCWELNSLILKLKWE